MIDQQNCKVKNNGDWDSICPFPIGFVYLSSVATSPANIYGGQWTELDDGRFLRPNGSWNETGGSSTHVHWTNMGHYAGESNVYFQDATGSGSSNSTVQSKVGNWSGIILFGFSLQYTNPPIGGSFEESTKSRKDSTESSSTIPIYRTVYCWYRTA